MPITGQEILDAEGYLVWFSYTPHKLGDVVVEDNSDKFVPLGTQLVVVGALDADTVDVYKSKYGIPYNVAPYYNKVIAE